jgi:opacity protein-like surface antigen
MIRSLLCAAVVAAMFAGSASAADNVKSSTLAKMGLSSMSSMSDSEGLAVRGKGSASVWGGSFALYAGHGVVDGAAHGYQASSHTSNALAAGADLSAAGVVYGHNHSVGFLIGVSGGGSIAYAK